jgi:hypothetical protein
MRDTPLYLSPHQLQKARNTTDTVEKQRMFLREMFFLITRDVLGYVLSLKMS